MEDRAGRDPEERAMPASDALRAQLAKILDWEDAHVNFDAAVDGVPERLRGVVAPGFVWSVWQLLEHIRLTQSDIVDFCRNPHYKEPGSMSAYWSSSREPPSEQAWRDSIDAVRRDREALEQMTLDANIDLFGRIPHGSGQTYLRELLLVADHTAYHVGQLVAIRRALGIWTTRF
jgi:uncharacterized damage-inducible protein DinB